MKDNESGILTVWANGTLLASNNNNALTNYASATADTGIQCFRLLGSQGLAGGYSAFTGNSQDIRVSDTQDILLL